MLHAKFVQLLFVRRKHVCGEMGRGTEQDRLEVTKTTVCVTLS